MTRAPRVPWQITYPTKVPYNPSTALFSTYSSTNQAPQPPNSQVYLAVDAKLDSLSW